MKFTWDKEKRQTNLEKHGVDFTRASQIFGGRVVEWIDDRYDYGETRIRALGVAGGEVLHLTYTWRGSARRIISARRANERERRKYY
ncbi:MAG: hypothetical protein BRC38_15685 [Cyanobacteria bacterium QH_6_48_35]|jgi:uncharacterized DUF497 family protein|nr:MAG: hypothetical protein BRC38_15685 [Cyanobacteria bacterium QH_6_48_35]PSO90112.1 MAG: hypothetical protein BRC41_00260 [Cyanobacteria bacterium QH_9_48_43]